jgi:chorismate mutase/prephenate dehydratase
MRELKDLRNEINEIDTKMRDLFIERMRTVMEIAEYKIENSLPVFDGEREREVIEKNASVLSDELLKELYVEFLKSNMSLSRKYQNTIIDRMKK